MSTTVNDFLPGGAARTELLQLARRRRWGLALALVGWLHLPAFALCWYLTVFAEYHVPAAYVAVWLAELAGVWLIFRLCGGRRADPPGPAERFVRRVWVAYFVLAFNLGSLNTLRGHAMFEFFPAMASLASFGFIMMGALSPRFYPAVLVMFASGLLMAANLDHAYLIFAVAWWLVLNGIGAALGRGEERASAVPHAPPPLARMLEESGTR